MVSRIDAAGTAIDATAIQRVLVIQPNGFGDALMTVSLFRLLRTSLPAARVTALVGNPEVGAMLQGAGLVDDAALLPVGTSRPRKLAIFRRLRARRFDIAFVATMFTWHHVVAARWIAGIPRVITDCGHPLARLSATIVPAQPRAHRFLSNGALLRPLLPALGEGEISRCNPAIGMASLSPPAAALLDRLCATGGPLFGLHLGSTSQPIKRLPEGLAIAAVRDLRRRSPECTILYLQGAPDPAHADLPEELRGVTIPIGGLDVSDLLHVLRACKAVLTGDTGIAHLAAAAGTKAVVAAGPTDIERTRPWGERHVVVMSPAPPACLPCYGTAIYDNDACPRGRVCLTGIRPGDLVAAMIGDGGGLS